MQSNAREEDCPLAAALALPMGAAVEVKPTGAEGPLIQMKRAAACPGDVARAFLRAVSPFVAT